MFASYLCHKLDGPHCRTGHWRDDCPLLPAVLCCCRRVWRGAFGNLLSGKDPRKPFVDAFADEQLLGFYKYYRMLALYASGACGCGGLRRLQGMQQPAGCCATSERFSGT